MTQSRTVEQIKINVMTQQQYDSATKNADEFYLVTDADLLPSQVNNSGKYLTTNGSALSWATVDALPSQIDNEGKYLTTDGTDAYWTELDISSGPSNLRAGEYINIVDDPGGIGDFSVATSEVLGYGDSHGYWVDLVYDGTQWVAITDSGYCKTSTDLETWSSVASIVVPSDCTGIATDGTQYIVITGDAVTAISTDLESWTLDTNNPLGYDSSDCYAESIIYDGTQFVAVNQKGWVSTSSDGTTWSTYQVPGFDASTYYDSSSYWTDILYDGTQYVMLNNKGYISTSTDLTNWTTPQDVTASYSGTSGYWRSMTYVGGKLLIMHNYSAEMLMSSDYENWSCVQPININDNYNDWNTLRSGDNKVVALHKEDAISIANATGPATVISAINVQPVLQSGTNIKTINGSSILGSGDLTITSLPTQQDGYNGKVLKTNGTSASWNSITWGEISGDRNAINNRLENTPILAGDNINITTTSGGWSYSTSAIDSSAFNAVAYIKDRFVAINSFGSVTTSADGTTWSASTSVSNLGNRSWTDVCCVIDSGIYEGEPYTDYWLYALSASGYISAGHVTSNSITWSSSGRYLTQNQSWKGIAYGNGKLVAISSGGYISTSTPADYTTWSTASYKSTLGNRSWRSIIYDGTKFVAVTVSGYISLSTDGTTWSQATQDTNLSEYNWNKLLYDGTQYIISGYYYKQGVYATSKDLINWSVVHEDALLDTASTPNTIYVYGGIAYNNNTYVILGYDTRRVVTCKPNKTIISATIPDFSEDIQNLNENKQDKLIAGSGITLQENSGADWTTATQISTLNNIGCMTYGNDKFVALTLDNKFTTSSDGITWAALDGDGFYGDTDGYWTGVAFDGTKFVAVDAYGYSCISQDGTTWGAVSNMPTGSMINSSHINEECGGFIYDGSKFIFMYSPNSSDLHYVTSTDGIEWTDHTQYFSSIGYVRGLAYGNDTYVALLDSGCILYSTTGTDWQYLNDNMAYIDPNLDEYWKTLYFDGEKFVAVHNTGYISTSADGINWTSVEQVANLGSHDWRAATVSTGKILLLSQDGYVSVGTLPGVIISSPELALIKTNLNNKQNQLTPGDHITITNSSNISAFTEPTQLSLGYGDSDGYWKGFIYDGSRYLAITHKGVIKQSTDLGTWTTVTTKQTTSPNETEWVSMQYDGNVYMLLDNSGSVSTTTDFSTWDDTGYLNYGESIGYIWTKLNYTGNEFIAIKSDGTIVTSSDGSNWSKVVELLNYGLSQDGYWSTVNKCNGKYCAIFDTRNELWTSTNGTTWSLTADLSSYCDTIGYWSDVIYDGNKYIALHSEGSVIISDDAENWTVLSTFNGYDWRNLCVTDNNIYAIGSNSYLVSSSKNQSLIIDTTGVQTTSNLVTSVSALSTDSQYPSAKLFYDTIGNIESLINAL